MFSPRQRRTLGVLCVFCYHFVAVVWSYSVTSSTKRSNSIVRQRQQTQAPSSHLLFSQQETFDGFCISDSQLIRSLIRAKSTRDVDRTLRDACRHNEEEQRQQEQPLPQASTPETTTIQNNATLNHHQGFPQFSLNVTAAALRRLALVSVLEARSPMNENDEATQALRTQWLVSLLKTIGSQIKLVQKSSPELSSSLLGVYALSDILQGLAILSGDRQERSDHYLQPLASLVMEVMGRYEISELYKLGPIRLVQCLQADAKLQLPAPPDSLRYRIYDRLLKPDAVSKLPARYLSHGLAAIATSLREDDSSLQNDDEEDDDEEDNNDNNKDRESMWLLTRAFMRRLRKQKVRAEASIEDLCRALVATNHIWNQGGMEELEDEAAIFGFTTLRAILEKKRTGDGHVLSARELSDMMSAWATLTNNHREDTVIEELLQICQDEHTLERCNLWQLERIVGSVEQLQITNHAETMRLGGERLVALVKEQQQAITTTPLPPKTVNGILRCPVLLHRRNGEVMKPYIEACSRLFMDEEFLEKCKVNEIANFLWFMSIAHWQDEGVLKALGRRVLDPRLVDSCSPKLACRILGTFTSILSLKQKRQESPSEDLMSLTAQLFHSYGGHLLTTQLSPAEVSSALYAYAKASYVQDMGIYDHLVSLMASMSSECSVRQLAQSLWSCGKMIAWERQDIEENEEVQTPPYLENANAIASELSLRTNDLSPVDVTQCIWALGRLQVANEDVVQSFADRAKDLVPLMNSVEVSNILWGLAKARHTDDELISKLTDRLTKDSLHVSPREAASALYALARMRVQDEQVFDKLSQIIIAQIDNTSAQALANTLWAYQAVQLRPPRALLNLWATEKLGLVGLTLTQKPVFDSETN
jgi:hypothetical protein